MHYRVLHALLSAVVHHALLSAVVHHALLSAVQTRLVMLSRNTRCPNTKILIPQCQYTHETEKLGLARGHGCAPHVAHAELYDLMLK
jgi:hypothetical protein